MDKDNGEKNEPKVILQVIMKPDGSCEMKTSLLPPMVVYLFEEMKFKLLTEKNQKPTLFSPNGSFINGARKMFKR